jgi:hypothetical protein
MGEHHRLGTGERRFPVGVGMNVANRKVLRIRLTPRPDCGPNGVAVAVDGCWECVDRDTCGEPLASACYDGTEEVLCDSLPPECEFGSVLGVVDGCWSCVNALTCLPWGVPGCETDRDCGPDQVCNDCATGSCPFCEDCVAACVSRASP